MRHLFGFFLAIAAAAAAYVGGSWGFERLHRITVGMTSGSLLHDKNALLAIAALAAVALLAGILLVTPWVSPIAVGLPGLVFIAWTVYYLFNVRHAVDLVPLRGHDFGRGFKALLADGALGAAGIVMLIPIFVPSRWRRPAAADDIGSDTSSLLADFHTTTTAVR